MEDPIEYDIVMGTDFRFPGGTTASVVEEVRAQHRAGYRTAAMQLASPLIRRPRPFADRIRQLISGGALELIAGDRPVRTKLLLLRHPSVLTDITGPHPRLEADQVLLVCNQVPRDDRAYYDVAAVHRNATTLFGREPLWAPISPTVRAAIRTEADVPMTEHDWENVIDLDQWRVRRTGFVSDRPVIGRHSREHWSKWPATATDILAAYPDDPRYRVRIMGGAHSAAGIIGTLPDNWTALGFNTMAIPQFLAEIDFHVYLHHPGLVEAFGRVVLEGLATGAVCFAPPALESVFGDVVQYGTPDDVLPFVDALYADPAEFERRSARGVALVAERFSHDTHVRRVLALIGPGSGAPGTGAVAQPQIPTPPTGATALICAMGQTDSEVDRVLSSWDEPAVPVVLTDRMTERPGVLYEHLPAALGPGGREQRLRHLVSAHRATTVVLVGSDTTDLAVRINGVTVRPAAPGGRSDVSGPVTSTVLDQARGVLRQAATRARQEAPGWVRGLARAGAGAAARVRRGVRALRSPDAELAVSAVYSHIPADAPVLLLVVASREVDPRATLANVLALAQESSAFRIAVLAPVSWLAPAAAFGVTVETWISEQDWPTAGATRRTEYARARIAEVTRLVRPEAVVAVDHTVEPRNSPGARGQLDMVEAIALAAQDGKEIGVLVR